MKIKLSGMLFLFIVMLSVNSYGAMSSADIDLKVKVLIDKMTLEEKVGQMTQLTVETMQKQGMDEFTVDIEKVRKFVKDNHVGSVLNCGGQANHIDTWLKMINTIQNVATKETRLKIPVLYGVDSIHGANYILEGTLFPQAIAMGATGEPSLVKRGAEITAMETRAIGIPWNFNPVLGVGRHPMWSRLWETFGEDTYIVKTMGRAYIEGLQGDDISSVDRVAGCMKHYLGYSIPRGGRDRTPAWIPDRELREIFVPPFQAAVDAGVVTVMVNSSEINGSPVHASPYYLKMLLRDELGFEGLVVTDWEDINNLYTREMVAPDQRTAVKMAVMAGVDMSMVPYDVSFYNHLIDLVKTGEVPVSRIYEAVSSILYVKYKLGLFENAYPPKGQAQKIGSDSSWNDSYKAAQKAMTLLKNDDNVLPLSKKTKVLVVGPTANLLKVLNGGWTYVWQGDREDLYPKDKKTILEALTDKIGSSNVTYVEGVSYDKYINLEDAVKASANCDVIIACLGEMTYCEGMGNIFDLTLPEPQLNLVQTLAKTGKPVVLVLAEGRPRVIREIEPLAKGILMAYLPGLEGGPAIADVLFGDYNPGGRLPYTYPKYAGGFEWYDFKKSSFPDGKQSQAQWIFGHGLSYTSFEYSNLKLSADKMALDSLDKIFVSVDVKNSGKIAGDEIVQLYLSDVVASITPPNKRLKGFQRISLQPGQTGTVKFVLERAEFSFIDHESRPAIEKGKFIVKIGDLQKDFWLE